MKTVVVKQTRLLHEIGDGDGDGEADATVEDEKEKKICWRV